MGDLKFARVVLTLALAGLTVGSEALFSQESNGGRRRITYVEGRAAIDGEVIVRYRERMGRAGRERAEMQAGSDSSEAIGRRGARHMRSRRMSTAQMLQALRANPDVEFVEPNYVIHATATPNDGYFSSLWGLLNTGQNVDGRTGTPGADISAVPAWDISTGSRANVIAVLDSGIDFNHPDLAANIWTAPRSFSVAMGSTTITCPAGSHGYNALANNCSPMDDNNHGTHVAGIIGAVGNNSIGVTGVNWTASLMAVKILGADGVGTAADAIEGIDWVLKAKNALGSDANVRIINGSWGLSSPSSTLDAEIAAANDADVLFVASAGSDGQDIEVNRHYPASGTGANIISVAAADNTGALASYSNYGATSVDLAAPGDSTLSTLRNGDYGYLSGTSMSAPFVSGAAALVLAACPTGTARLKSALMQSVDPHSSLAGRTVSGGTLNVAGAIQRCLQTRPTVNVTPLTAPPGSTLNVSIALGPGNARDWVALYPVGGANSTRIDWKYLNNSQTAPGTGLTDASVTFTAPSTGGSYEVRFYENDRHTLITTSNPITVASQPTISVNDVTVTEGNSGTATATFTVTVSPVNSSQTVTVNYATANGTATAGVDYVAASGVLNFAPSTATQTVSITVNGDTVVESNETFLLNLSGAVNAAIGDGQAVGTIATDDAPPCTTCPTITLQSTTVAPGGQIEFEIANGPGNAGDWVTLTNAASPDNAYTQWQYLNGSQTPPSSGRTAASLGFTAPTTPGTYDIRLFANNALNRIARSGGITVASQPSLSIADVSVTEGNSGTVLATFTVTLSPVNSSQAVTVNYATADGTATTAGNDYTAVSGTLTFPASTSTRTFTVSINGDSVQEPNETFTVNLSAATNAVIGDGQAIGTIVTDDAPAGPSVSAPTHVTPGSTITVTVTNGPGNPGDWIAIVPVAAGDNAYTDWRYLNGSQTMPASGVSNATVSIAAPTTVGNYDVRLFANNKLNRIARSGQISVSATAPTPTLTIGDRTVTEGNSGGSTVTFTVTLSPVNPSQTVTVNYATADGTATIANSDYVAANGTLTFAPSVETQTFTVTINGDTAVEANETFLVNLSGATNATVGDAQAVGTISNDDAGPAPSGPSVTVPASASPGATFNAVITNGPANATDWVALVPVNSPDNAYVQWWYLNGSKTAPGAGVANATVQFTAPTAPGSYDVRLFANNQLNRVARSGAIAVASSPTLTIGDVTVTEGNSGTTVATFTVTMAPVNSSATVTVNYATADGSATTANNDYVAATGTLTFAPNASTQTVSVTVNGDTASEATETFSVNLSGATNATIGDGSATGTINNDDGTTGPAINVTTTSVQPGGTISFTVSGGPANPMDWVTLSPASAPDNGYVDWKYLNGSRTAPASGVSSATLQFTAPTTPGTYNIRFFADNRLANRLATSVTITVAP